MEKVIDLTDKQSRLFGLGRSQGCHPAHRGGRRDLGYRSWASSATKIFVVDPATRDGRITLPAPEVLSTRLDERAYLCLQTVDRRTRSNETSSSNGRARQEAVAAIEKAARSTEVIERARRQAERQMKGLFEKFGVRRIEVGWRPS